ncbi:MAG: hypothetical protein QOF57_989 [Frankiaceae bacterium]|nr:hypothetical protein [Frankiaceae bacterium]
MTDPVSSWSVDPLPPAAATLAAAAGDVLDSRAALDSGTGGRLWGGPSDWRGAAARAGRAQLEELTGRLTALAAGLAEVSDATGAAAATLGGPLGALHSELAAAAELERFADSASLGLAAQLARAVAGRRVDVAVAEVRGADRLGALRLDDSAAAAHALLRRWNTAALRDLLTAEGLPPGIPAPGTEPETVADWWASRTAGERAQLLMDSPGELGSLAGLPAADRDVANRLRMQRFLASYDDTRRALVDALLRALRSGDSDAVSATMASVRELDRRHSFYATVTRTLDDYACHVDAGGRAVPVQLLEADPDDAGGHGAAAVVFGDLDTAANVAYIVPGFRQRVVPELPRVAFDAWRVRGAAGGGGSVATVAWVGYDVPMGLDVAFAGHAATGATRLARALRGLRASRRSRGEPHLTVVAHSYGSTVAGLMLRDAAGLAVDDLVVVGSPGLAVDRVSALRVAPGHVWVGAASGDPVDHLGRFGTDPASGAFGARRFVAETSHKAGWDPFEEHSHYFDVDGPSLVSIGAVVAGRPDDVAAEAPRPASPAWLAPVTGDGARRAA